MISIYSIKWSLGEPKRCLLKLLKTFTDPKLLKGSIYTVPSVLLPSCHSSFFEAIPFFSSRILLDSFVNVLRLFLQLNAFSIDLLKIKNDSLDTSAVTVRKEMS